MTAEIRAAVPPEVGVPIPLGEKDEFYKGIGAEGEWRTIDVHRVPVVPTCQTCGGRGDRYCGYGESEACEDCGGDGVARRWTGTVTVAGGDCPECEGDGRGELFNDDYGFLDCPPCEGKGTLPDRRFRIEGDVVPVVEYPSPEQYPCIYLSRWDLRGYPGDPPPYPPIILITDPMADASDVTAAFPDGPPAVGTWAVVPENVREA